MPSNTPQPSEALCPYFGECGGCQAQDLPYAEQLARKAALLKELFQPYWANDIPVTPSPVQWHYRNKVDPSFAPKRYPEAPPKDFVRETVLGFKKKGRWYWPLDISECRIGPEGLEPLLAATRTWYQEHDLRAFDSRTGEGFLRHLLVRDAKRTGERMAVLITREGEFDPGPFLDAVQHSFQPHSIYRGVSQRLAGVAIADHLELLHGAEAISEALHIPDPDGERILHFSISPFSFFQTNPLATEKLYGLIRAWVRRVAPTRLYDLYGGMGGIGFSCADLVECVWSVETVESASEDGRANAKTNGIENVEFITEKVKNYLLHLLRGEGMAENSAVVLDPARSGLHPKAIKRLLELAPANILYVSCNPKILAQEMPRFLEAYRLESLHAVDLFPHTRHVELIAELCRTEA